MVKPTIKLPDIITKLTNITDEMLKDGDDYKMFAEKFININSLFVNPTYIAHNGNNFDHKIMTHYGLLDSHNVKFLDSRQIILNFTKNYHKTVRGKLTEMYLTIMEKEEINAHRAEADVMMVVKILNKLDIIKKMQL
jgi:DNA polymerase III epsilon subunit-like protein